MTTNVPAVYAAIRNVMTDVSKVGIAKNNRNVTQGFNFRGIDDVLNALSRCLSKSGLVILPSVVDRHVTERTNSKGSVLFFVTLTVDYSFVAVEDGSRHVVRAYGEAMDSGDKATNKAMSAAYKYACFQTFCIPTEGDNDADAATHEVVATRTISGEQVGILEALLKETGRDEGKFAEYFKIKSLPDLSVADFDRAVAILQKKRAA
jgi:hypothetical protein